MRHKSGLLLSVLAGAFGLIALPTAAARADTTTVLSDLGSFHQIVADTAEGYLFFSEGTGSGSLSRSASSPLFVTTLTGSLVATIDQGDGVEGMTLSPDGKTLYAALAGRGEVAAIDVASIKSDPTALTQTLYPLTSGDVPYSVALQSGKIWVSYNVGAPPDAAIGDINLSAATPSSAFEPATAGPSTWYSAPDLAADPDPTGTTLLAYQGGSSVAAAATFNTNTDPVTTLSTGTIGSASSGTECGFVSQVAVVPGGAEFAAACGQRQVNVYSTQDVTKAVGTSYATPGSNGPAAVAIAPDGTVAAGALGTAVINTGGNMSDVAYVYSPGGGTAPRNIFDFAPGYSNLYEAGGLAWAADGSELFAVVNAYGASGTNGTWNVVLQTFREPETTRATLMLGGTSSADIGKSVTIAGTLQLGTGNPPANTPITITRTMAGTATEKHTVTTGAKGAFSFTDKPTVLGTYTYTASYAGNSTTQAATVTRAVQITRLPVSLTLTTNKTDYTYKAKVTITARLGATYAGRTVTIYAQAFGSPGKKEIKSGRVNDKGDLTAYYSPASSTTFSAYFGGDAKYAPKTVTHNVYVGADVSMSISGYYTSEDIGSTLYRVFHHTATLKAPVTVSPNKHGECVKLELQQFFNGTWYPDATSGCGTLSSASKVTWRVILTNVTGGQFRIRTDYIRSSTDKTNLGADSSWYYFTVVK
jgi:hypothetical protein